MAANPMSSLAFQSPNRPHVHMAMRRETEGEKMKRSVLGEIAKLRAMTIAQLRSRYTEVFGEEPRSRNKDWLWKRIAFRIQELDEGSISERALERAEELANEADLRVRPSSPVTHPEEAARAVRRDPRLPPTGTVLRRAFAGKEHEVRILDDAFELGGRTFKSLSAVAREITGSRWNGFVFFGLAEQVAREANG